MALDNNVLDVSKNIDVNLYEDGIGRNKTHGTNRDKGEANS